MVGGCRGGDEISGNSITAATRGDHMKGFPKRISVCGLGAEGLASSPDQAMAIVCVYLE